MNDAFYIGASGLRVQETALQVVANNITNINTTAFKRGTVQFAELVAAPAVGHSPVSQPGPSAPSYLGVMISQSPRVFTQGDLSASSNPMDVAIQGNGFFEVVGPSGQSLLWRGGTMQVNSDGYLSASNGLPLRPLVSVPRDATGLTISESGQVNAYIGNQTNPETIGQLELTLVDQPQNLQPNADGLYQLPATQSDVSRVQPGQDSSGTVSQGFVEASNVHLTDEMVNLLVMQRAYAANAKVVQAGDDLMSIVNGLKR
jgi:flagellar basal-body rod protein FlgG